MPKPSSSLIGAVFALATQLVACSGSPPSSLSTPTPTTQTTSSLDDPLSFFSPRDERLLQAGEILCEKDEKDKYKYGDYTTITSRMQKWCSLLPSQRRDNVSSNLLFDIYNAQVETCTNSCISADKRLCPQVDEKIWKGIEPRNEHNLCPIEPLNH